MRIWPRGNFKFRISHTWNYLHHIFQSINQLIRTWVMWLLLSSSNLRFDLCPILHSYCWTDLLVHRIQSGTNEMQRLTFDVRGEGNCEKIVWSGHKKSKMSSLHRTHTSKTLTFYTNRDLQLFLPSYPKRCWWRNFHFFKINSSKWTSYKCQG